MPRVATLQPAPAFPDELRRVLGHLSHPRTLASLVRVLDGDASARAMVAEEGGPQIVDLGIATADLVEDLLEQCVRKGWAKNIGDLRKASELHTVPNADPDVIDIPRASADILRKRARTPRGRGRYLDAGDNFILTRAGLAMLTAPVPYEPPPLEGPALRAALERNVALAEEAVEAEHQAVAQGTHPQANLDAVIADLERRQATLDEAIAAEDEDDE